jgi:phosphoenolpyruvate synthase/pyruvate phosphate dikinase
MSAPTEGGTREVDVPQPYRDALVFDDSQIIEVAHLALALEADTGWPVDVECAYQGRDLFLLQWPITTLR